MNAARVFYRTRQFWLALWTHPAALDLTPARAVLTPALAALFARLQPSEQAHSLAVLRKLQAQDETHPDLLAAALLHDVGKSCAPLQAWERVMVVLARALVPGLARRWGQVEARHIWRQYAWRRPFIVAEQHPAWGAELAAQAGASARLQALIRRHQDPPGASDSLEDDLLRRLQSADDES
jgi:hypothetical protein